MKTAKKTVPVLSSVEDIPLKSPSDKYKFQQARSRKAVECDMMDGRIEKIPVLNPKYAKCYYPMGKILSHGYVLTGYLPMCFSSYFIMHLIGHGDPEAHLESGSFLNYVDTVCGH